MSIKPFPKRFKLLTYSLIGLLAMVALFTFLGRTKPVKVAINIVEAGQVQNTVANTRAGTLSACRRAGLSAALGGQISRLPVKEGESVKTGQILMELWNEDRVAQVTLAEREAQAAKARATQACVVADVAQRNANRLQTLRKQGIASEEITDQAIGDAQAKKAACNASRTSAKVSLAQLEVAIAMLSRTVLSAPFDGTVAQINGEVGEYVTPSPVGIPTPPAIDLVDNSCLYVSAPIDEVDAPKVKLGMSAIISLDAYDQRTYPGKVRRIAAYVLDLEKQARTVEVEVDFVNDDDIRDMLAGYSADIEVILSQQDDVTRIPTEAIIENNQVFVLGTDGLIESRKVKTGLSNWAWTEIIDGLEQGERVVTSVDREGVAEGVEATHDPSAVNED